MEGGPPSVEEWGPGGGGAPELGDAGADGGEEPAGSAEQMRV